jgi:DNA (cytosine-5)-methyltransferase 1
VSEPKPPYRIPPMAEIAAVPWNLLTVASTFSGAGGSCLGFRMAGYRTVWANEFVPAAAETYRANAPDVVLNTTDIRTVTAAAIRAEAGLRPGQEVDVLEGSPPCASFSTAGKRSKGWGKVQPYSDVEQRVDDLFGEFVRLVGELRPRAFVAENVSGLTKGVAKGQFKAILAALAACGYAVEARLLDAQWLGVPQRRERVFFVGVRNDLGRRPAWPAPFPYRYTVADACPWIGAVCAGRERLRNAAATPSETVIANKGKGGPRSRSQDPVTRHEGAGFVVDRVTLVRRAAAGTYEPADAGTNCLAEPAHTIRTHGRSESLIVEGRPLGPAVGKAWDALRPGENSAQYLNLVKAHPDAASPTVTAKGGTGAASVAHPYERRKFTIAELKRICGFPDDFALTGTYAQQWERLGRAVPPPMMAAVARALVPVLWP